MPTTLTSQFTLYQALLMKVGESLLLCYQGIAYFIFLLLCTKRVVSCLGSDTHKNTFATIETRRNLERVSSPSHLWDPGF